MRVLAVLILVAFTVAGSESSRLTISGPATVIDGDTIIVDRTHIRLFGVDAPESDQRCKDAKAQSYNCGMLAADVLQEEIGGANVVCFPIDTDQYRRTVAICIARGRDLARVMVERGWAVDYEAFSGGFYGWSEREARAAKRGLWAGEFQQPREWRREKRR